MTVPRRRRVRIVGFDQAEAFCWGCHEWLPLTMTFWPQRQSFGNCRACDRERVRLYEARRRLDPEYRLRQIQKSRAYRAFLRGEAPELVEVEARHQRLDRNDRQNARRVFTPEERAERRRAYKREWNRRHRANVDNSLARTA